MNSKEETMAVLGLRIPLIGVYIGWGFWRNEGEPASVFFDYKKVLANRKWLLGFWHTHPFMINYPSGIDHRTMYTWCNTVGKPLFCMIEGIDSETMAQIRWPINDAPILISNNLFTTYPIDDRPNKREYVGHASRFGRLFIWRREI